MDRSVDSSADRSSSEDDEVFLRMEGITKVYASRDGPVRALDTVSIEETRGEFLSILGPSGCGKSTLLMIAAGLIPPSSGIITVKGSRVTGPRTDIGIVFPKKGSQNRLPEMDPNSAAK